MKNFILITVGCLIMALSASSTLGMQVGGVGLQHGAVTFGDGSVQTSSASSFMGGSAISNNFTTAQQGLAISQRVYNVEQQETLWNSALQPASTNYLASTNFVNASTALLNGHTNILSLANNSSAAITQICNLGSTGLLNFTNSLTASGITNLNAYVPITFVLSNAPTDGKRTIPILLGQPSPVLVASGFPDGLVNDTYVYVPGANLWQGITSGEYIFFSSFTGAWVQSSSSSDNDDSNDNPANYDGSGDIFNPTGSYVPDPSGSETGSGTITWQSRFISQVGFSLAANLSASGWMLVANNLPPSWGGSLVPYLSTPSTTDAGTTNVINIEVFPNSKTIVIDSACLANLNPTPTWTVGNNSRIGFNILNDNATSFQQRGRTTDQELFITAIGSQTTNVNVYVGGTVAQNQGWGFTCNLGNVGGVWTNLCSGSPCAGGTNVWVPEQGCAGTVLGAPAFQGGLRTMIIPSMIPGILSACLIAEGPMSVGTTNDVLNGQMPGFNPAVLYKLLGLLGGPGYPSSAVPLWDYQGCGQLPTQILTFKFGGTNFVTGALNTLDGSPPLNW